MNSCTFPDIFLIDPQGGAAIGMAVVGVWAVGWVFRQIVVFIRTSDEDGPAA